MYVPSNKELASQLRSATIILKNKILIELLRDAAERIEDLEKIAEYYRKTAESKKEVSTDEAEK